MKFIIIRDNLREALSVVEKTEAENTSLPILKNILLETDQNKIRLTSTNLEVAITSAASGKVIEQGKFTVPMKLFSSTVHNIQNDRLNLEIRGGKLCLSTDDYEANIQGVSADEFPPTPRIQNQDSCIEIQAGILKEAFSQVLVSSQPNDLRPELNSVFFEFTTNSIKVAATDSFRLSEKTIGSGDFRSAHTENFILLIPLKTAAHVARAYKDDELIKIYHDENQVLFKTDRVEILSRLVEGTFPEYGAIVPREFDAEIILNKNAFANAIKLVSVFSNKNNEVRFTIQENKKVIEITSSSDTVGENNYILSAKITGKTKDVVFNWKYVVDVLRVIETEEVFIGIHKENEPALIKPTPDASYFYILKPIAES